MTGTGEQPSKALSADTLNADSGVAAEERLDLGLQELLAEAEAQQHPRFDFAAQSAAVESAEPVSNAAVPESYGEALADITSDVWMPPQLDSQAPTIESNSAQDPAEQGIASAQAEQPRPEQYQHSADVRRIIEAFHREQATIQGVELASVAPPQEEEVESPSELEAAIVPVPIADEDPDTRNVAEGQVEGLEEGYADFLHVEDEPLAPEISTVAATEGVAAAVDAAPEQSDVPSLMAHEPYAVNVPSAQTASSESAIVGLLAQAERQDWGPLAEACEQSMSQPESSDASLLTLSTLLWARAQLKLAILPASIASAALEADSLQHARLAQLGDERLLRAAAQCFLDAAKALERAADYGACTQFYERACACSVGSRREFGEFLERRLLQLKAALERPTLSQRERTEIKQTLQGLEERRRALAPKKPDPREDARGARPSASAVALSQHLAPAEERLLTKAARPSAVAQAPVSYRSTVLLAALVLAILAGSWLALHEEVYLPEPAQVSLVEPKQARQAPNLIVPVAQRAQLSSGLDALLYDIASPEKGSAGSAGERTTALPEVAPSVRAEPVREEAGAGGVAVRTRAAPREVIDTRGPIEGSELREELARAEQRRKESEREYARLWEKTPKQPEPQGSDWDRKDRPRRTRDAEFYRVLVRTDVLAEPHYSAEPIGSVESGERILVDARLGHWLRLKPQRGQPGYILAQDAAAE